MNGPPATLIHKNYALNLKALILHEVGPFFVLHRGKTAVGGFDSWSISKPYSVTCRSLKYIRYMLLCDLDLNAYAGEDMVIGMITY